MPHKERYKQRYNAGKANRGISSRMIHAKLRSKLFQCGVQSRTHGTNTNKAGCSCLDAGASVLPPQPPWHRAFWAADADGYNCSSMYIGE
jgi:hypothetical protein